MSDKKNEMLAIIKNDSTKGYTVEKALDTIERINTVANNCDYARALIVNSIAKSDLEDWKKTLNERFGYSNDHLNKLVKIADRFLSLESDDVKAIEERNGNVYDIMVSRPEIVHGLHDKNDVDFNISQMQELVFLDDDNLQKELASGNIKANMTVKAIREVVDKYKKHTKKTKENDVTNSNDDSNMTCKNDKERLAMCCKLLEAITTDTIKKHKNMKTCLQWLETMKEYAK